MTTKTTRRHDAAAVISLVFFLPLLNGLMHLPPAIGAIWTALGRKSELDIPVLSFLFALHALIDVADKFIDLPSSARQQWSWRVSLFAGLLIVILAHALYLSGIWTLLRILLTPILVIVYAIPLIPYWSCSKRGLRFTSLKLLLGASKSVFAGFCIALMDVNTITVHICSSHRFTCIPQSNPIRTQAFLYALLYDFLLETTFDLRDIEEDAQNKIKTLPVVFGRSRTLLLLFVLANAGDVAITWMGEQKCRLELAEGLLRATLTWVVYLAISYRPRDDIAARGFLTLIGLLPVWWAQSSLL